MCQPSQVAKYPENFGLNSWLKVAHISAVSFQCSSICRSIFLDGLNKEFMQRLSLT